MSKKMVKIAVLMLLISLAQLSCSKDKKQSDSELLLILGLASGGTINVYAGGRSYNTPA